MPRADHLLLYDGVCGLCNRLVQFVIPRDKRVVFDFASLQSDIGRSILRQHGRAPNDLDTFYVVTNYRTAAPALLSRARAALFVVTALGGLWRAAGLLGLLPTLVLDWAYDLIARRRYRLFGRYDKCLMPPPEHKNRFIDV
jgi:predicted DCC family thiol-disulfide oxidoreductase YuxK